MSHSMTDPAGETCEHGVRWAFDCAQCGEFGGTLQFCSFPKLSTNSAWKLVPVEPTPEMLDAMQTAGIAAFDADVAASLGDTPLDPTHARRAVWQAALDAAPDIENNLAGGGGAGSLHKVIGITQSAEPCRYVRSSAEGTHWCALAEQPADYRDVMRQALDALSQFHRSTGWGDDCLRAVNALRAALGEKK